MNFKSANQSFIAIILFLVTGFGGYYLGQHNVQFAWDHYHPNVKVINQAPPNMVDQTIDFKLFWDVYSRLQEQYVDKSKLDAKKLYYGAIQGMVASLGDPYTVFLPPTENKASHDQLAGHFDGIGAELGSKDKKVVVVAPLQDSPAEKAGIKTGDWIIKVDGKDTYNLTLPEVVDNIRGEKGTKVTLQILHEGATKPVDVSITRDVINVKSVAYSIKQQNGQNIGYIKLSQFGEQTDTEWQQAVSDIVKKRDADPAHFKGIILDVRNNPGGFLTSAVFIGSEFIKDGTIVMQEDARGQRQNYTVNRLGQFLTDPVVVLTNKGSASASEIVSGALRDRRGAKLIGDKTFGKGTVQEAEDLGEGAGLHVTTAKWLTPNGTWTNATQGFDPDIAVALDPNDPTKDAQLDRAMQELLK